MTKPKGRPKGAKNRIERLDKRKLLAMQEALTERLAGEIENDIDPQDYEDALIWVNYRLRTPRWP